MRKVIFYKNKINIEYFSFLRKRLFLFGGNTVFIILGYMLLMVSDIAFSQAVKSENCEEGVFSLRYKNFKTDIIVYINNDSIYIPLTEFFQFLRIYYSINDENDKIYGYLSEAKNEYEIDLVNEKFYDVSNRLNKFSKSQYLRTETEVYFTAYLISQLFMCEVDIFKNTLSIKIESRNEFPILTEENRYNKYAYMSSKSADKEVLPLVYDRDFRILDGGSISYNIGGVQQKQSKTMNYSGNVGLQLLGGEFLYNAYGGYNIVDNISTYDQKFRWKYSFVENPFLTGIGIGDLSNISLRSGSEIAGSVSSKPLWGIQFSNENTLMPTSFNTFVIDGKVEPGWQIELYINDQLTDVTVADNLGYYKFNLPVNYGNTNVEFKFYGPKGEFVSKRQAISVPGEFIKPGSIKYNINLGKSFEDNIYAANGNLSFGLTNWFSNSLQFQKIERDHELYFINSTSIRLFGGTILNSVYFPKNYGKGGIRIMSENWGTYNLIYTKSLIKDDTVTSIDGHYDKMDKIELAVGLPRLLGLPFSLTFRGANAFDMKYSMVNVSSSLSVYLGHLSLSASYGMYSSIDKETRIKSMEQNIGPLLNYNWYEKPSFLSFLKNTSFSVGGNYSVNQKRFKTINFSVQQQITQDMNLSVSYSRNIESKYSGLNLALMTSFPSFIFNSSVQSSNFTTNNYMENISGNIGLNTKDFKFYFGNQGFGGDANGAAVVRFFVDKNDDGIFNKGEEEIPEVQYSVPNATVEKDESGDFRIYNLIPAVRYNLHIKKGSIRNPFIVPKYEEFSFIAEPYTFKVIDVPCYMTGSVEGNAYKIINNKRVEQGGIRAHLINLDTHDRQVINLFSDGSFYKLGISPGKYKIYLDSMQLKLLKCNSKPNFIFLEVKSCSEGDQVSGLNFELYPVQENEIPGTLPKRETEKSSESTISAVLNEASKDTITAKIINTGIIKNSDLSEGTTHSPTNDTININKKIPESTINGKVAVFDFDTTAVRKYVEKTTELTCTMKLSDGKKTLFSNCDNSGKFIFNNVSPGKWYLSLYKGGLPENHIIEKMFLLLELKEGERKDVIYRILPLEKKR